MYELPDENADSLEVLVLLQIVARINADMRKALALPEVRTALSAQGMEIAPSSPEEMGALMRKDASRWAGVVKQAGIKAE